MPHVSHVVILNFTEIHPPAWTSIDMDHLCEIRSSIFCSVTFVHCLAINKAVPSTPLPNSTGGLPGSIICDHPAQRIPETIF